METLKPDDSIKDGRRCLYGAFVKTATNKIILNREDGLLFIFKEKSLGPCVKCGVFNREFCTQCEKFVCKRHGEGEHSLV